MKQLLTQLLNGHTLNEKESVAFITGLAHGEVEPAVSGAILAIMRLRGETAEEIRGCAQGLLELAHNPHIVSKTGLLDTCGTGGDGSHSLNVSTGVALLAAACGVPTVKHGNRSVSSRSGSADVLEHLGYSLHTENAAELTHTGFTFLFAPRFHPAMAKIMPVRRALGVRTLFNILGPLCNPARPAFQMIGTYDLQLAEKMAHALAGMPHIHRALVIHGKNGWDEATPICPFHVYEVREGQVTLRQRDALHHGLSRCEPESLKGGDATYNAMRLRQVLENREHGPHRDTLLLGTGLALELTGRVSRLDEGIALAREVLDSGNAAQCLPPVRIQEVVNG